MESRTRVVEGEETPDSVHGLNRERGNERTKWDSDDRVRDHGQCTSSECRSWNTEIYSGTPRVRKGRSVGVTFWINVYNGKTEKKESMINEKSKRFNTKVRSSDLTWRELDRDPEYDTWEKNGLGGMKELKTMYEKSTIRRMKRSVRTVRDYGCGFTTIKSPKVELWEKTGTTSKRVMELHRDKVSSRRPIGRARYTIGWQVTYRGV